MRQATHQSLEPLNTTSSTQTLCLHLLKLQEICSKETELFLLTSRAAENLRYVARHGWEQYWLICKENLAAARQFWSQREALIADIAKIDIGVDKLLLGECRGLLDVCDQWVSAEEEILELNDLSAETYVLTHEQRDFVWHKYFCDES